jgi:tetraacyldisaccharide-1-P 4'-kinase
LEKLAGNRPLFQAELLPMGLRELSSGKNIPLSEIRNKRIAAFSGIANPLGFKKTLLSLGLVPAVIKNFGDHADYGEEERDFLEKFFRFSRSDYLVSTSKDALKLCGFHKVPILILETSLVFRDPEGFLSAILTRLPKGPKGSLSQSPNSPRGEKALS